MVDVEKFRHPVTSAPPFQPTAKPAIGRHAVVRWTA